MLACEGDVYFVLGAARSVYEQRAETGYENDDEFIVVFRMDGLSRIDMVGARTHVRLGEASLSGWASSRLEASLIQLGHIVDRCILTSNNGPRR